MVFDIGSTETLQTPTTYGRPSEGTTSSPKTLQLVGDRTDNEVHDPDVGLYSEPSYVSLSGRSLRPVSPRPVSPVSLKEGGPGTGGGSPRLGYPVVPSLRV